MHMGKWSRWMKIGSKLRKADVWEERRWRIMMMIKKSIRLTLGLGDKDGKANNVSSRTNLWVLRRR